MNVAAVIVTRGDVWLEPILETIPRDWQQVIWDNGGQVGVYTHQYFELRAVPDLSVYGRYAAIEHTDADLIYVQDDDCILAPESFDALLAAYQPGHVVANMPERFRPHYPDSCLVGFGAIFDRDLPEHAFGRFERVHPQIDDDLTFLRTADVVFTALTPRILLDLPYEDREFASAPNRMWKQKNHVSERAEMLRLARQVRDSVPA